jgi:hypothetical protein
VVRELGLVRSDGKRGDSFELSQVLDAYLQAKRELGLLGVPVTKTAAAELVRQRVGFQSVSAAMAYMQRANRRHRQRFGSDLFA